MTHITVVGGGITGLSTAYYLQEAARAANAPLNLTLIESQSHLGGKISTDRSAGFVIEGGPDSFLTQKPWGVELCRKLGLEDSLVGTNEASRRVYVVWNGKLHKLPDGVLLIVPTRFRPFVFSSLISWPGKLRMGLDLLIPPRRDTSDESVANFIRRRLGSEALDKIAEPLMGGIHVSDPERQSLQASFPRFIDLERKYGSLIRGMVAARARRPSPGENGSKRLPMFMSLRGGLSQLVETLSAHLDGVQTMTGRRVIALDKTSPGYRLRLDDNTELHTDVVVLATPAYISAGLVRDWDARLAERLNAIRYVSTATVSLAYRRDTFDHDLQGFGFVIPSKAQRRIAACTWTSTKFNHRAPDDHVLLRVFLGGAVNEKPALADDATMLQFVREELRSLMGVNAEPVLTRIFRWERANPQYDVGHLEMLAELDTLCAAHPGLYLAGSAYRGVGLPDCIHDGQIVAQKILGKSK